MHHFSFGFPRTAKDEKRQEKLLFHSLPHPPEGPLNQLCGPVAQNKPNFLLLPFIHGVHCGVGKNRSWSGLSRSGGSEQRYLIYSLLNVDCFVYFLFFV